MLSSREAQKQINRLASYGRLFTDMLAEGKIELAETLRTAASSPNHAERIIDKWLQENRWMPTVSDLYALADQVPEHQERATNPTQCGQCGGHGWKRTWMMVTYSRSPSGVTLHSEEREITKEACLQLLNDVDGITQKVATTVKRCDCENGERIRQAKAMQAAKDSKKLLKTRSKTELVQ